MRTEWPGGVYQFGRERVYCRDNRMTEIIIFTIHGAGFNFLFVHMDAARKTKRALHSHSIPRPLQTLSRNLAKFHLMSLPKSTDVPVTAQDWDSL